MTENNSQLASKQPRVFRIAFATAVFERIGFYLLSALLVLYVKAVFHFSDASAFALFGVFTGLAYITPALGGYLADNVFGIRRSIILGLFLEGTGLAILAIPVNSLISIGLAFIIAGVGFYKTAPTDLMARSYKEHDPRIDSGFTLFYMAINIGSFTAMVGAGLMQFYFGWHAAFFVAACSLLVGLFSYFIFRRSARRADSSVGKNPLRIKIWRNILLGTALAIAACAFLVAHVLIANIFFFVATGLIVIYFFFEIAKSPKDEKLRILACLLLISMGFVFFLLYYQAYTSINLFVERNVARHVFGFHIPTVSYIALNPFWILVLSPIFAKLYDMLERNGKNPAVTTKFPLGIFLIAICFLILAFSANFANSAGKISSWWIVIVYFIYSAGELLTSALGVAMVTHIAPKHLYGVMMGAWFLIGMGLSASCSGLFAGLASIPKGVHDTFAMLHIYSHAFLILGVVGMVVAIISFLASPYLKRIAQLD